MENFQWSQKFLFGNWRNSETGGNASLPPWGWTPVIIITFLRYLEIIYKLFLQIDSTHDDQYAGALEGGGLSMKCPYKL